MPQLMVWFYLGGARLKQRAEALKPLLILHFLLRWPVKV